jgi:Predicted acetyltransferase
MIDTIKNKIDTSQLIYKIISIEDIREIKGFKCGNGSMELFLQTEAYASHIHREASTTLVYLQDKLVGYFTIKHEDADHEPWVEGSNYKSSLDIARIAVSEDMQNNGIGTEIINEIIKKAIQVNERFITLDALKEKWEWYKRFGFDYLFEDDLTSDSIVVTMILDLYDVDLIDQYWDQ